MKFLHTADWQIGKPFAGIRDEQKRALVQHARIEAIKRLGGAEKRSGPMTFDGPPGGTREQVAAAGRLAIAGLLAAGHDGAMPVVLDDAIVYFDPEGVQVLQRMPDLGATRGLQIIVLTCNPSHHAALGAHQAVFTSEQVQGPSASPGRPGKPSESSEPDPAATTSVSDDDKERLLSVLAELGGKSGNHSSRDQLGWDEAKYRAAKDQLVADGHIVAGKGGGGSVALS